MPGSQAVLCCAMMSVTPTKLVGSTSRWPFYDSKAGRHQGLVSRADADSGSPASKLGGKSRLYDD